MYDMGQTSSTKPLDVVIVLVCPYTDRDDPVYPIITSLIKRQVSEVTTIYDHGDGSWLYLDKEYYLNSVDCFVFCQVLNNGSDQDNWFAIDGHYYLTLDRFKSMGIPSPNQKIVGINLCLDFIKDPPVVNIDTNFGCFNVRFTRTKYLMRWLDVDKDFESKFRASLVREVPPLKEITREE
jgi:hypothetical protein